MLPGIDDLSLFFIAGLGSLCLFMQQLLVEGESVARKW